MVFYEKLFERLAPVDPQVKKELMRQVAQPIGSLSLRWYEKKGLVDEIKAAVQKYQQTNEIFEKQLNKVNADRLNRVYEGMTRFPRIPDPFLQALYPWEHIYFFAGARSRRRKQEALESSTLFEVAAMYIQAGIADVARVRDFHRIYTTSEGRKRIYGPDVPRAKVILEEIEEGNRELRKVLQKTLTLDLWRNDTFEEVRKVLRKSTKRDEYDCEERIAIMLCQVSDQGLVELTREFGPLKLKGFARK